MTGKKRMFVGLGILLGMLTGTQGTAAYQSAFDGTVNTVIPGNVRSEIGEEFPPPPTITPDKDTEIDKKIWVSNSPSGQVGNNADCYIRVSVGYSNSEIGKAVSMKNQDSTNWIYHDDGFFYYKNMVREGEATLPLCTGFMIDHTKVEKSYWKYLEDFQIQIYEESVEAGAFKDYQEAWQYYTYGR